MFNLRKEQLKIFETIAAKDFEQREVVHLREHFPDQCSVLDEATLLEIILYGAERAKVYGIMAEGDVAKYIDVMFTLGKDFDRDSKYSWAARTLSDPNLDGPGARIDRLWAEVLEVEGRKGTGA